MEGVLAAIEEVGVSVPVVVRLEGNNAEKGSEILAKAKVKIESLNNLKEAAKKAVELAYWQRWKSYKSRFNTC